MSRDFPRRILWQHLESQRLPIPFSAPLLTSIKLDRLHDIQPDCCSRPEWSTGRGETGSPRCSVHGSNIRLVRTHPESRYHCYDHSFVLVQWDDLKSAWSFLSPGSLKAMLKPSSWMFWRTKEPMEEDINDMDPHYKLMINYNDAPDWWYGLVFFAAGVIGLICIYEASSGMSWWAFIVATILAAILILFTGA